ncbi:MAG: 2-oxoglutarate and iron-dependent oxygenase domain-containing protein, partial [Gammaproteobacteria bacterium]|nr:2-oxoglutarate and iron-dependent oxygenase domain-containing protein [Gammaproteobacteria bacterium]
MSAPDRLPIIDVTALNGGAIEDMPTVAREIGAACERHGFFYITGH